MDYTFAYEELQDIYSLVTEGKVKEVRFISHDVQEMTNGMKREDPYIIEIYYKGAESVYNKNLGLFWSPDYADWQTHIKEVPISSLSVEEKLRSIDDFDDIVKIEVGFIEGSNERVVVRLYRQLGVFSNKRRCIRIK